jgi:indole-3-glycerol phosphate synthase
VSDGPNSAGMHVNVHRTGPDVLAEIIATTRQALTERQRTVSVAELEARGAARRAAGDMRSFRDALAAPGLSVIAEHKRSSPSAGEIRSDLTLPEVVVSYERGGASALSVLTEETRFGGALEDLAQARAVATLPILRKDFIVDPYQLHEALAAGADAVLLIVVAFDDFEPLEELHALADELGLDALVEVHDAAELEVALALGAEIVGINNRNLSTLKVDIETTLMLRPLVPAGSLVVAESGFRTRAELERLAGAGVDAVLIGEALMRALDVEAACRELTGVPTISL